jgi:uncharacterized protein (DUF885 family)
MSMFLKVARYITWPGQATGYKIGQLKIRELRTRAEEAFGPDFNLRDFHEVRIRVRKFKCSIFS